MGVHVWLQVLAQEQLIRIIQHTFVNLVTAAVRNVRILTIVLNV